MFRISIKDLYIQIIVLNLVIFLLANIAQSLGSTFFIDYFAMPFQNVLSRFWTIITCHFLHVSFGHVFNNMIIMLLFGFLAKQFFKSQSVLSIYIVGGIFGSVAILLLLTLVEINGVALGASAAVFALMGATVMYYPTFKVNLFLIGQIELKWIAIVLAVLGIVIDFSGNIVGNLAHLGGGIFGLYYGYQYRKGKNILLFLDNWFAKLGLGLGLKFATLSQTKHPKTKHPKTKVLQETSLNDILDKISKKGIKSLSKEEKEYLNKS